MKHEQPSEELAGRKFCLSWRLPGKTWTVTEVGEGESVILRNSLTGYEIELLPESLAEVVEILTIARNQRMGAEVKEPDKEPSLLHKDLAMYCRIISLFARRVGGEIRINESDLWEYPPGVTIQEDPSNRQTVIRCYP